MADPINDKACTGNQIKACIEHIAYRITNISIYSHIMNKILKNNINQQFQKYKF